MLLLSQDCSTLPLIRTLYCWVLSKEVSSTIFFFKSLWYDATWDWTPASQTIGEHSTQWAGFKYSKWLQNSIRAIEETITNNTTPGLRMEGKKKKGHLRGIPHALKLQEWSLHIRWFNVIFRILNGGRVGVLNPLQRCSWHVL